MKRMAIAALAMIVLLLASCATTSENLVPEAASQEAEANVVPAPAPEPEPIPTPEPEPTPQPVPESEPEVEVATPRWNVGEIGPNNGIVFECNGRMLEAYEPFYDTPSYDSAEKLCEELSAQNGVVYRLPSLDELKAIYDQLVVTELFDVDWTYYWSSDTSGEDAVMIFNFDTGFEGRFYKDNDFVAAIPVSEL